MKSLPFLAYRSFYTPLNTIEKFGQIGYDTICIFPAHTVNSRGTPYSQYPPVWLWYDRLNFAPLDDMIHDIDRAMPDAKFLCMIDLNSPAWLEHMNAYSCSDTFNNLGKAVLNKEWFEPTRKYLEEFLSYTESRYGDRILAYVLACGATDEWYDYSNGSESPERRAAWRKWCVERGMPDPVDIPPESQRNGPLPEAFMNRPAEGKGPLDYWKFCYEQRNAPLGPVENYVRDPGKNRNVVDYWKFCNETIADTILSFAETARKIVRKETQIGCFYGYILEKTHRTLVSCGHLEYEKVLDSPDIDFLISPGTYTDRQIGGGSGFLIPNGTARVREKRLLHECDQRTHTYNSYLTPDINLRLDSAWPDEKSTVAGLKREAALALLKGAHLWWFDMWGDYYQGEAVLKTLEKIRELWFRFGGQPLPGVSEIALIVDPESTYYMDENHPKASSVYLQMRNKLNYIGAPFEVYSFRDIPKLANFDRCKLAIFPALFEITPEKMEILTRTVLKDNRSVLWLTAPGVIRNGVFDKAGCEQLTSFPCESAGLQFRAMNGWNSRYLYDFSELTVAELKQIAEESGVHLYTDTENPVYAEGNLLALHTKDGGRLSLRVPGRFTKARELFTDLEFVIENGGFTYEFAVPDTALFELS